MPKFRRKVGIVSGNKNGKVVVPIAPLAKIRATGCPTYEVIVETARKVFANRGTLSYAKDEQQNLIEQAIAIVLSEHATTPMSNAELAKRTKSICRKILRREKVEFRNGKGKRETLDRVVHPNLVTDPETGDRGWHSPLDDFGCDSTGAKIGYLPATSGNRNVAEDRTIERIYAQQIAAKLDREDVLFILDYVDRRRRDNAAISDADRQRFHRLRKQALAPEKWVKNVSRLSR
jgi:hypothetical protein